MKPEDVSDKPCPRCGGKLEFKDTCENPTTGSANDRAERKRLLAMDEAFCASVTAAIKRGQEKEPNVQALPE